jgi:peptidyl-tRNA hydrolase
VHDDIDLPLGQLRVTFDRGSGGHRGVQNVIDRLGSNKFYRFRFGIRPYNMPQQRSPELMQAFVTRKMTGTVMGIFDSTSHFCTDLMHKGLLGVPIVELLGDYTITPPQ